MGFEVDDLEAVVAELRRRGVVFEDVDVPGLETRTASRRSRATTRARAAQGNVPPGSARARAISWGSGSR
jgi:hypothetical protein